MKKRKQDFNYFIKEFAFFVLGGAVGLLILEISWQWLAKDYILPGVKIAEIEVGGRRKEEALLLIEGRVQDLKIEVKYGEYVWEMPKNIFEFSPNKAIEKATEFGKTWNMELFRQLFVRKLIFPMAVNLKTEEWQVWETEIKRVVTVPSEPARLSYTKGKIELINGEDGIELDLVKLKSEVVRAVAGLRSSEIELPIVESRVRLSEEEISEVKKHAEMMEGKIIKLQIEDKIINLNTSALVSFLNLNPTKIGEVDEVAVKTYVEGLAERYNRESQNARFVFEGGRVKEFAPGLEGIALKTEQTADGLQKEIEKLIRGEDTQQVEISYVSTPPKVSTGEVNNMGIVELIGKGESDYAHSITNRIYNVGLAASRVSGVLIPPGEEFSFNQEVGEITGATGYKTAYVITNGRTELGDGGGVCQVSTTLFRAVMKAGLPISERFAHAYRVGYYEQNSDPGFDATVYSPSKDFKFRNDTPGHILIQAINDPINRHLVFELYGTNDGRVATTSRARISGVAPPPPDLYQDDPTLPAGEIRQVDWSAWGAKVVFDYRVLRDGLEIFSKTYVSNYRPWQNVYLRGTGQ